METNFLDIGINPQFIAHIHLFEISQNTENDLFVIFCQHNYIASAN